MALPAEQNYQVSGTGGAGTNGQPTMYIPGMKSLGSTGESTMAQQKGAMMYSAAQAEPSMPELTPLTAPTTLPGQAVTDGAPIGPGANSVEGLPMQASGDPDIDEIRSYYPILQFYASQPGASQGTKDYVTYLGTII
jgi:hypothetical protein